MEIIKIVSIGIIGVILIILLKQYRPEFSIYISIIVGIIILTLTMDKLTNIINLIKSITNKANINTQFIAILIKMTGIAFLSEFAVSICKDSRRKCNSKKNRNWNKNNYYINVNTNNNKSFRNNFKNITIS